MHSFAGTTILAFSAAAVTVPNISGVRIPMNIHDFSTYLKIFLLAVLGVAGLFRLLAHGNTYRRHRGKFLVLLWIGAALALGAYFRFGEFNYGNFLHYHDVSHYYLGSKYAPELGYFKLYKCIVIAEAEDIAEGPSPGLPPEMARREIRVLDTYEMRSLRDIVEDPAEIEDCKQNFTPERWMQFRKDIRDYYPVQRHNILYDRCNDLGYNGSPVYSTLAGFLSEHTPVERNALILLAMLDLLLLAAAFIALGYAYGTETSLMALIFYTSTLFNHQMYIHHSILRFDWMAFTLLGLAFMKLGRYRFSGAFFAYAVLVRLFPAFLLVGFGLKGLLDSYREKRLSRPLLQFCVSFGITAIVLLGISLAHLGPGYFKEYKEKLDLHSQVVSSSRFGFPYISRYLGRTLAIDANLPASEWEQRKTHNDQVERSRDLLGFALIGTFLVLLVVAARRLDDDETVALAYPLLFFGLGITVYYGIVLTVFLLYFLRNQGARARAPGFAAFSIASVLTFILHLKIENGMLLHTWASILILVVIVLTIVFMMLENKATRGDILTILKNLRHARSLLILLLGLTILFVVGAVYVLGLGQIKPDPKNEALNSALSASGFDPQTDLLVVAPPALRSKTKPFEPKRTVFMMHPEREAFWAEKKLFVLAADSSFTPEQYALRPVRKLRETAFELSNSPVHLYELDFEDNVTVSWRLKDRLAEAKVSMETGGRLIECPFSQSRHVCSANEWNYVGPIVQATAGDERELVWAHPVNNALVIVFPHVTLGEHLLLGSCLSDFAVGLAEGAPVLVEVFIGDTLLGSHLQANRSGYATTDLSTRTFAGQTVELRFRISAANQGRRHFAFDAMVF